jgi:hypothetical protein
MTAKDLIDKLSELSPDTHIFIEGEETGLEYPKISPVKEVVLDLNQDGYYGSHEPLSNFILLGKENINPDRTIVKLNNKERKLVKGIILK